MGSNWSFGPWYNNSIINFSILKVLCRFLLLFDRSLKHQNLILHKFYLAKFACKLNNAFFRVVFHNPDNIIWCNFSVWTLWHCHCMGKQPRKMRIDAFYESTISLYFFCNMCCYDATQVRIRSLASCFSASFFITMHITNYTNITTT